MSMTPNVREIMMAIGAEKIAVAAAIVTDIAVGVVAILQGVYAIPEK